MTWRERGDVLALCLMCGAFGHSFARGDVEWSAIFALSATIWFVSVGRFDVRPGGRGARGA